MPSAAEIDKKMERRASEVCRSRLRKVIEVRPCYETGGGVVVTKNVYGEPKTHAHYFKPRQLKRAFLERELTSAHERIAILDTLRDEIEAEKAEKTAPHDLKVGDVIAQTWGTTMRGVFFHVVTDVPHPRTVSMVKVEARYVSGDWMSGSVVPDIEEGATPQGEAATYPVEMKKGQACVRMCSHDRATRWDGKPVSVYSD